MGNFIYSLLSDTVFLNAAEEAVSDTMGIINGVLIAALAIIGVIVIGIALWIGFRMATAEDESKRKEAKKQLLWAIIGLIGVVLLIVLWTQVFERLIREAIEDL